MLRSSVRLAALVALCAPVSHAQWELANYTDLLGVDDAEYTPDGRYVVIRDNTILTSAHVFDARTGARLMQVGCTIGTVSGTCQDAVAVTNERAVVIGSCAMVLDLTNLSLLTQHDLGFEPRDVAITPDGAFAAVRGGNGLYIIELAGGSIVASAPGNPAEYQGTQAFDVDSVAVTDEHAVFTSEIVLSAGLATRVSIFELRPSGGGPPQLVYETTSASDQGGKPNDLALTPDGRFAAVRSDYEVGLYDLQGTSTHQAWRKRLYGNPGTFHGYAMDSIEVTQSRIATISYLSNGAVGTQLDVFDLSGTQKYARFSGQPHDVCLTPNDQRVAVRTRDLVALFDVRILPHGDLLTPLDEQPLASSYTSYNAGLDSIVATDERVAALARTGGSSLIRIWNIRNDLLEPFYSDSQGDKALDLEVSPDGNRVIFGFYKSYRVVDLRSGATVLTGIGTGAPGSLTWCDGVAINDTHATAFGVGSVNGSGWISLLDLFEQPLRYCDANPNSSGRPAALVAAGSASVANNDLRLWSVDQPPGAIGMFFYGDIQVHVPFGDGFLCVAGNVGRFGVVHADAAGLSALTVDYNNLPAGGGAILPGSTWNFQQFYRDLQGTLAPYNTTDALAFTFGS